MNRSRFTLAGLLSALLVTTSPAADIPGASPHYFSAEAVHRYDGAQHRWSALHGEHSFAPVDAGELLLVGGSRGLVALDADSGAVRWRDSGGPRFSPSIAGDIAYAGAEDGRLRALAVASGELIWQRALPGWVYSPAIAGDTLVSGGSAGQLWGLARADGTLRWSLPLGAELVASPIAGDGIAYATTFAAELLAVTTDSGALRWRRRLPVAGGTPQLHGDQLLIRLLDGSLAALDRSTGALRWHHRQSAGRGLSAPRPHGDNTLLIEQGNGRVALLDMSTGHVLADATYRGETLGPPVPLVDGVLVILRGQPVASRPVTARLQLQPIVHLEDDP